MVNRLPVGPSFGAMDFATLTESLHAPMVPGETYGLLSHNCDVFFVIDAPVGFSAVPAGPAVIIFLDRAEQNERDLPEDGYQVICPAELSRPEFVSWAARATTMLRDGFMQSGMMCLDVSNLRDMLRVCRTKRLVLHIIDYDDLNRPPLAMLETLRFRNVFAWLFGDASMNLQHYSELSYALERIYPFADPLWLGANHHDEATASLLLLGEPASEDLYVRLT